MPDTVSACACPMGRREFLAAGLAAAVALQAGDAAGAAGPSFGPAVGETIPAIGTPPDHTGAKRTLDSLMGTKGLVLFFFRSADWCPFCQAQMMDLNSARAALEQRGYRLAGISYDSPEILKTFIERRKIGYALLSDPKSDIIDRFRLRDPQYTPPSRASGVPRPIIFILDRRGTIQAKLYEETYQKRPPAKLLLETVDGLKA
jgi:peroxiredoxin